MFCVFTMFTLFKTSHGYRLINHHQTQAILDRLDESVEFGLPDVDARKAGVVVVATSRHLLAQKLMVWPGSFMKPSKSSGHGPAILWQIHSKAAETTYCQAGDFFSKKPVGWGVVWGVVCPPHCKGSIIVGWTLGSTRPILSFSFRDPPHLLPVASQISLASASQYRHLYVLV